MQGDWVGLILDVASEQVDWPHTGPFHLWQSVDLDDCSEAGDCLIDGRVTREELSKLPTGGFGVCALQEFSP